MWFATYNMTNWGNNVNSTVDVLFHLHYVKNFSSAFAINNPWPSVLSETWALNTSENWECTKLQANILYRFIYLYYMTSSFILPVKLWFLSTRFSCRNIPIKCKRRNLKIVIAWNITSSCTRMMTLCWEKDCTLKILMPDFHMIGYWNKRYYH